MTLKIDFENQILAFFDVYFWPFKKSHEKTNAIFVISVIMASIWNVFIKFRWHDEKLTRAIRKTHYLLLAVFSHFWKSKQANMYVFHPLLKVQLFREGHKNLGNLPFWCLLCKCQNHEEDFCGLLRKGELYLLKYVLMYKYRAVVSGGSTPRIWEFC